jgi:hypothetical protein
MNAGTSDDVLCLYIAGRGGQGDRLGTLVDTRDPDAEGNTAAALFEVPSERISY